MLAAMETNSLRVRGSPAPDFAGLDRLGLNLHAVLDLAGLSAAVAARLPAPESPANWRQLLLVGNAGPALWRTLQADRPAGDHPIDEFSVAVVERWFAAASGGGRSRRLYPGNGTVDLQALGRLAGWHRDSPLKIGIHPQWGSWFGYRVLLLTDTDWPAAVADAAASPCDRCAAAPCRSACPAGAVGEDGFDLERCVTHRSRHGSDCAHRCPAREACPVGVAQRYDEAQIRHSYGESLRAIERYLRVR